MNRSLGVFWAEIGGLDYGGDEIGLAHGVLLNSGDRFVSIIPAKVRGGAYFIWLTRMAATQVLVVWRFGNTMTAFTLVESLMTVPAAPSKLMVFVRLMRLDKPIGIYLVLWPTWWSLWLAAKGMPSAKMLVIFTLGAILMRSAGCVINDYADRHIDGRVRRTAQRPLVVEQVTSREALVFAGILALLAFGLVLLTTQLTVFLSLVAVMLASAYPFMKRHTFLPQVVLGAAFAWSIPMAFAAQTGQLPNVIWLLWVAVVIWTTAYDTFYAMVDREDDLKIGVKSTAILFGDMDRVMTGVLQVMFLWAMVLVGQKFGLGRVYALGLLVAAGLLAYQQYVIRRREPSACFAAFTNNNWVGMAIFVGIALDYALQGQAS